MRKVLPIFFLILISAIVSAQTPGIHWSKYISNTGGGFFYDIKSTPDNGYIAVGNDSSFGYDRYYILRKFFGAKAWIVKMDSIGNVQWQKSTSFNGATHYQSVALSLDGGYAAAGLKVRFTPLLDSSNFYITKYNAAGTIVWEKEYGGTKTESANCIIRTSSGGYAIAGYTSSNDGDVTGNHSPNLSDVWLMKTDASGNIIWKKCFGGSAADTAYAIIETPDKGFLVAASSASTNGNLTANNGLTDAWLFKTDSLGNILWQKNFGGAGHDVFKNVLLNADGTYTVTGYTTSTAAVSNGIKGKSDLWVAKVNDAGTVLWSKGFGGSEEEEGFSIISIPDGSYVVSGYTGSNTNDVSGNNGSIDAWIIKVSASGNIVWQKCVGTIREEIAMGLIYHSENSFTIGGLAQPPSYPSDPIDAYVVKLGNAAKFSGMFIGQNPPTGGLVQLSKPGAQYSTIPGAFGFSMDVDTGAYSGNFTLSNPYYTVTPSTFNAVFPTYFDTLTMMFTIQAIPGRRDININAVPLNPARPGFNLTYKLFYKNIGTDIVTNGAIVFKKDSRLNFISAIPAVSSTIGDTLKWNYSNFKPFDTASITINMSVQTPPAVNINDTLSSVAIITPVNGDLTPADDTAFVKQVVVGSYDPNDKSENLAGKITLNQVANSSYINYLIRFQNTGTDTAFNVTVRDTLDSKLDWNSLQMIASSHPYQIQINSQNRIAWQFNNIRLPDSNRNELRSHGFIAYRIKPKNNLVLGDTIKNSASIYFDYNLPVMTNRQNTVVSNNIITGINNVENRSFAMLIFPNPADNEIWVRVKERVYGNATIMITDITGRQVYRENLGRVDLSDFNRKVNLKDIVAGVYIIGLFTDNKFYVQKLIIQ